MYKMDYYSEEPIIKKPEPKVVIDKFPIDKRQIDYLRKLKAKLEDGVNVKILPKTKMLFKELFGLDTDSLKVKSNKNPLEDEDVLDLPKPIEELPKPSPETLVRKDNPTQVSKPDEQLINAIVERLLAVRSKPSPELRTEAKPSTEPMTFTIIHRHYHYRDDEEEDIDPVEDDDEDLDQAIEEANKLIKEEPTPAKYNGQRIYRFV